MVENKMLVVFDFDHTVVSEDSITGIIEELSLPEVPKEVMDKWDVEGTGMLAVRLSFPGFIHSASPSQQ
ncbi:hypothetical protein EB796_016775 [Bugula neritina]|uniref:Uncharacterized protein n=1 Tax=Bugula neritina TaxID=10212 RepID=A0A7J7JHT0_BUGNE|nr:hypothetical protein EB796_016775 [Bugula neritina]